MTKQKSLQKISIVFEETGEEGCDSNGKKGKRFLIYLDGHTRNLSHVNEKDLSTAEFWASRCFSIVMHAVQQAGVVEFAVPRKDSGIKQ